VRVYNALWCSCAPSRASSISWNGRPNCSFFKILQRSHFARLVMIHFARARDHAVCKLKGAFKNGPRRSTVDPLTLEGKIETQRETERQRHTLCGGWQLHHRTPVPNLVKVGCGVHHRHLCMWPARPISVTEFRTMTILIDNPTVTLCLCTLGATLRPVSVRFAQRTLDAQASEVACGWLVCRCG
jgi:hypothetical protein